MKPGKKLTSELATIWERVRPEYEPLKVVGKGAFGQTVKAFSTKHQRHVAIKYLDCASLEVDRSCLIYYRELAILRQLAEMPGSDRHVSTFLDIIAPDDLMTASEKFIFIVMDYAPMDLLKLLDHPRAAEMEENDVVKMVYELLCHLRFLHSAGLLHRDFKPANVLVDKQMNLTLCDFGLARAILESEPALEDLQASRELMKPPTAKAQIARSLNLSRDERRRRPRQMSRHVTSRWYRAPEVILLEKNYSQEVDLWALGCVTMELLYCSKAYRKKIKSTKNRILFQGKSCYPLSPREDQETQSDGDQLGQIVRVLGDPDSSDLSFITLDQNRQYAETFRSGLQKIRLDFELPSTSPALLEVLGQMLQFNPFFRPSAQSLLSSPVFDQVRMPELEKPAPCRISLEESLGIRFSSSRKRVVEGDLRKALLEEIDRCKAHFAGE